MSQLAPSVAPDAPLAQRPKLKRSIGGSGAALLMISAILSLDSLGVVSSFGAQAFTWLVVLAVLFLAPYGLVTSELGTAFPAEGGPYIWVREAFGRRAAAVVATMYWVDNPIWLGGTLAITASATVSEFFFRVSGVGSYVFGLAFVWVAIAIVVVALRLGTIITGIGAIVRVALIALFCVSLVIYALRFGVHGFGAASFKPTWSIFIIAAPVLVFGLQGFEVPSNAAEELSNPSRDVPLAIARSGVITVLSYGLPVLGILLILPSRDITNVGGFIDAMKTVFVIYGGHRTPDGAVLSGAGRVLGDVAAIGLVVGLLTAGATWLIGSDRAQAVAGLDGAAPRWFGRFSPRFGTPVSVNLTSGIVASVVLVLSLALTGGNVEKYYSAALGLVISMVTVTYILIFPSVIKLRYTRPHVDRPYRIPGGTVGLWLAGGLATAWCVFTTVSLLYPGVGTAHPDAALPPGFAGERLAYELSQIIPLCVMISVGLLFSQVGRRQTPNGSHEEVTGGRAEARPSVSGDVA